MAIFVASAWVEARLNSPDFLVLDPRRPTHYLQGHLFHAINLPVTAAFDAQNLLLPVEALEKWMGAAGLDSRKTPVIYDAHDGRNGAMLAWILEYLGRADVHLMEVFLDKWREEKRELFYRPIKPVPAEFHAQPNPRIRAVLKDVSNGPAGKLVDCRSRDEYTGKVTLLDDKPGHIPGAMHIAWQDLLGEDHHYLARPDKLRVLLAAAGVRPQDPVVAYCRTGVRAAVAYLAFQSAKQDVVLYDGSFAEWSRQGMPVEK